MYLLTFELWSHAWQCQPVSASATSCLTSIRIFLLSDDIFESCLFCSCDFSLKMSISVQTKSNYWPRRSWQILSHETKYISSDMIHVTVSAEQRQVGLVSLRQINMKNSTVVQQQINRNFSNQSLLIPGILTDYIVGSLTNEVCSSYSQLWKIFHNTFFQFHVWLRIGRKMFIVCYHKYLELRTKIYRKFRPDFLCG